VARTITGTPAPYPALPWFWSKTGGFRDSIASTPRRTSSRAESRLNG
jgi:hypothetical protein